MSSWRLRPGAESNFLRASLVCEAAICILLIKEQESTEPKLPAFIHSSGWRFSAAFKSSRNPKVVGIHYEGIALSLFPLLLTGLISIIIPCLLTPCRNCGCCTFFFRCRVSEAALTQLLAGKLRATSAQTFCASCSTDRDDNIIRTHTHTHAQAGFI